MAKFSFRLQTLLKLRKATRDKRLSRLTEAYRASDVLQQRLGEVQDDLRKLKGQTLREAEPGTINVDQLLDAHRYELVLNAHKHGISQQQEAVDAETDQRRQALLAADRQVRVLETLREKQVDRHRHEENRKQQKEMDEIAGRSKPMKV